MSRCACLLLGAILAATARAAEPGLSDYAYTWDIQPAGSEAVQAVDLPLAVYRAAADPRLRDLGVFNGAGEAVPRTITTVELKELDQEQRQNLTALPLYADQAAQADGIRLRLQQTPAGAELQLDTSQEASPATADHRQLAAYLVDISALDMAVDALELGWPPTAQPFIGRVTVSGSRDLDQWRPLGGGSIADLTEAGTRIERRIVELERADVDYLRLTWSDLPGDWQLESLQAIRRDIQQLPHRLNARLEPLAGDKGHELQFDLGGSPPIDRLDLVLASGSALLEASLLGRDDPAEDWRSIYRGRFYQLNVGQRQVQSAPVLIRPQRLRYWLVRVEAGRANAVQALDLGWRAERLVFLAQGQPPFRLAVGSGADVVAGFPQERAFGRLGVNTLAERAETMGQASLGNRREAGGPGLRSITRPRDWRTWMLWAGLLGTVAIIGYVALSLRRQMLAGGD